MEPKRGWLAIDIETEGDPWSGRLVSIAVCDPLYPDVFSSVFFDGVPEWLADVLASPDMGTIEHTLYDARWLQLAGYTVAGPIADTRLMAWNVDENTKLDLESLVYRYLGHKMDKRLRRTKNSVVFETDEGNWVPLSRAPRDEMARYNADDTRRTAELFNYLKDRQPSYWDRQLDLTRVLLDMECNGLPIDVEELDYLRATYTDTLDGICSSLTADLPPDFNLNSGDQVAAYLFLKEFDLPARVRKGEEPEGFVVEKEGRVWSHGHWTVKGKHLHPTKWTEGKNPRPKVDAKTLAVAHGSDPWVVEFLEYQKLNKVIGTYLNAIPKHTHGGRVYGTYNQAGTVSGRLSSSDPNMQNMPRRGKYGADMRHLFKGQLIVADYSQLEPRLMAHFSGDERMRNIYISKRDIYRDIAMFVFETPDNNPYLVTEDQRDIAKTLVLGMGYGAQARKVAEILSIAGYPTTQKKASQYLSKLHEMFPRFFQWREEIIEQSKHSGYVTTLAGRKRHIGYVAETAWKAERQAVNSVIQGSAADIVNETMILTADIPDLRLLAQVHDEIVYEYEGEPPLEPIQAMGERGHGFRLSVPLVFEPKAVTSWGEK